MMMCSDVPCMYYLLPLPPNLQQNKPIDGEGWWHTRTHTRACCLDSRDTHPPTYATYIHTYIHGTRGSASWIQHSTCSIVG